jgi:ribonuclease R
MGYPFDIGKRATPKKFQRLLEQVKGTRHEVIIEELALRTMMKAVYSTGNAGHFGLAFKHYTHFTSPIRRYPDLTVHRLLKAYSSDNAKSLNLAVKLTEICEIATEKEIAAQEAERESIKAKQVQYMADHIGEEFDGVVSGVTAFGLFVEIPEYLVEGLVPIADLDDYFVFDEAHYRLTGQTKGEVYQLGDAVKVRLVRVLQEMRKMDFELVEKDN